MGKMKSNGAICVRKVTALNCFECNGCSSSGVAYIYCTHSAAACFDGCVTSTSTQLARLMLFQ